MEIQPIKSVKIDSPRIIPTIDPPVTQTTQQPLIRGLEPLMLVTHRIMEQVVQLPR